MSCTWLIQGQVIEQTDIFSKRGIEPETIHWVYLGPEHLAIEIHGRERLKNQITIMQRIHQTADSKLPLNAIFTLAASSHSFDASLSSDVFIIL